MPLLDWSFRRGNWITYPRCYMSSTAWMRVPERIRFRLCVLVHRCLHSTNPTYLVDGRRHVGRGADEPFNTRRPCIPSGCIESVKWLAFLSHSCFVTVDVSSGTEDLSLPVEFSVTYFGRSLIISDTIGLCSASVAYMLILHSLLVSLQRFVHDTVTVIICIWDVTVASTLAGSYVDTAATGAGFVADQAADRKTAKYADLRAQ